jgi:hypothetical protein
VRSDDLAPFAVADGLLAWIAAERVDRLEAQHPPPPERGFGTI